MPRGRRWFGWGFGNPYPFCRWSPWLPRWWWAHPTFNLSYYAALWAPPYLGYWHAPYARPCGYLPYTPYY